MATTIRSLAEKYRKLMVQDKRTDGSRYWKFRDMPRDEEEICRALAFAAHGDMLPDDWRYAFIYEALSAIEDADDPEDVTMEADIYTSELTSWLSSRADRVAYCDEAIAEYGIESADMFTRMQYGQQREKEEVLNLVRAHLSTEVEEAAAAEEDAEA